MIADDFARHAPLAQAEVEANRLKADVAEMTDYLQRGQLNDIRKGASDMHAAQAEKRYQLELRQVEVKLGPLPVAFLFNSENEHAASAVRKICRHIQEHGRGPGLMIPLTGLELDALNDPAEFRAFP